jgi:hypothetical protein
VAVGAEDPEQWLEVLLEEAVASRVKLKNDRPTVQIQENELRVVSQAVREGFGPSEANEVA